MRRAFRGILVAVVAMTLGAAPGVGHGQTTLTLMTYNIHVGIPMDFDFGKYTVREEDLRRIGDLISAQNPDVVGLQEVDCEYGLFLGDEKRRTSAMNEPRMLSHFTGLQYAFGSTQDDIKYPSDNGEYVEWGTSESWTNNGKRHGEVGNCLLVTRRFKLSPSNVSLPRRPDKERRAGIGTELRQTDGRPMNPPVFVYSAHLQHDNGAARNEQMLALLETARTHREAVTFVLGDMNYAAVPSTGDANSTGPELLRIVRDQGFYDLHGEFCARQGRIAENTFPAKNPDRRIDYVFCNRDLEVLDARVVQALASDHLPLVVTVRLPTQ